MARKGKRERAQERVEAIERLRKWLPEGSEVVTVLRHVSSSGMSRSIDCYRFYTRDDGNVDWFWLSYNVALAIGCRFSEKHNAVTINGAGMDMGFDIVHSLSLALYGRGDALKHRWLG